MIQLNTMTNLTSEQFIDTYGIDEPKFESDLQSDVDITNLPEAIVAGTALLDSSQVPNMGLRSAASLALTFAGRVAEGANKNNRAQNEDEWLAEYLSALRQIGFSIRGSSVVNSEFRKKNVSVHEALIPFLTVALGGAAAGPVLLGLLENLKRIDPDTPWITFYDRETRRYDLNELHFAAAKDMGVETHIQYAVARLHLKLDHRQVLFVKINESSARFESMTTTLAINNDLLLRIKPNLESRLSHMVNRFIWDASGAFD